MKSAVLLGSFSLFLALAVQAQDSPEAAPSIRTQYDMDSDSAPSAQPFLAPIKTFKCENATSYSVHLTFDDGPRMPNTERILDILKKENIKATFFITGENFPGLTNGHPTDHEKRLLALIARMKAEGHTVGSHSYEHIEHGNIKTHTAAQIEANLLKNDKFLIAAKLAPPMPFRFPYGSGWFDDIDPNNQQQANLVNKEVRTKGFQLTHWDVDSFDWSKIKRKALPTSVLKQICSHEGGIVLMHDIQPTTVENLPAIITSIRNSGHQFVTLAKINEINQARPPNSQFTSLAIRTAGFSSCHRPASDFDQVFATCQEYKAKSTDIHPLKAKQ